MKNKIKDGIISTSQFDTSKKIKVKYINEYDFNKLIRSLKTYNMVAYKEFIFKLMNELRGGKVVGKLQNDGTYKCRLQQSKIMEFVYGECYFTYKIEGNDAILINMEPHDFLIEGHARILETYKGVPITSAKDRFKVDLYKTIKSKNQF